MKQSDRLEILRRMLSRLAPQPVGEEPTTSPIIAPAADGSEVTADPRTAKLRVLRRMLERLGRLKPEPARGEGG